MGKHRKRWIGEIRFEDGIGFVVFRVMHKAIQCMDIFENQLHADAAYVVGTDHIAVKDTASVPVALVGRTQVRIEVTRSAQGPVRQVLTETRSGIAL